MPQPAIPGAIVLLCAFYTNSQHAASRGTHRPHQTEHIPFHTEQTLHHTHATHTATHQRPIPLCALGVLSGNTSPSLPLCPQRLGGERKRTRRTRRKAQKVNAKSAKDSKERKKHAMYLSGTNAPPVVGLI